MASDRETVAEVLAEFGRHIELMRKCKCVGVSLWNCLKFKLRIEVAYRREMDARALIAGVSLADAVDDEHRREVAALRRRLKVAEDALTKLDLIFTMTEYAYGRDIAEKALAAIREEAE